MTYTYGGDCPECGITPLDGFEGRATWFEVYFTCPYCGADVVIDVTGGWSDDE